MREIKFRAWDHYKKQMVEVKGLKQYPAGDWSVWDGETEVLPCNVSIMQFTGLTDRQGKKIYEGDHWQLGDEIYIIIWHQGDLQTGWKKRAGDNMTDIGKDNACRGEVIGNIYEGEKL